MEKLIDLINKIGGIWLIALNDKTKLVIDVDLSLFDNYMWYKKMGTLESPLDNIYMLLKDAASLERISY